MSEKWDAIKEKWDQIWVGTALGALLPVVGFFISKMIKDREGSYSVKAYWYLLIGQNDSNLQILTFSLIPNLLVFYLFFFQWQMDKALKGLIFITVVYLGIFLVIY